MPKNFNVPSNEIELDQSEEGETAFDKLLTQLFYDFGTSKELQELCQTQHELLDLNLEYLTGDDRSLLNDIEIKKSKLDELIKNSSVTKVDYDEEVRNVSAALNREINQRSTSMFQYYSSIPN